MQAFSFILQSCLLAGLLLVEPISKGLATEAPVNPAAKNLCKEGTFVKDELYFGLSKPNGGSVTALEWQQFLNRVVTPRFREGLTVVYGYGQYLDRRGSLVVEPSRLLILVHENTTAKERAIAEIITTYKQTFQQESVLRIIACVQVSF
jgi:hypothetical protein